MGKISKQLKRNLLLHFNKKVVNLAEMREAKKEVLKAKEALESMQQNLEKGISDPLHHAYISIFGFISSCMYGLANLKEMKAFKKIAVEQEDLYMPSGPPMSPLTDSYYSSWELLDLTFGPDKETLTSIFLSLAPELKLSKDEIEIIDILNSSRMGIYEIIGREGEKIWLKELITNKKSLCVCPAGYKGKVGQLWYVRLLPPILGYVDYSVIMTTPYVLLSSGKKDWINFFTRNNINDESLYDFMKFGPLKNYWHEFVFYGFFNFTDQAVFLGGVPDKPSSLPRHDKYEDYQKTLRYAEKLLRKEDRDKIARNNRSNKAIEDLNIISENELPDVLNGRKASEVFLDYTMPIIDSTTGENNLDLDELDHALRVPWMIWNACIYDQSEGKNAIAEMKKQMPGDKNLRDMFLFFEQRKKNDFSQYNYLMGEYKLIPKGKGEFNLKIESRLV